MLKKQLTTVNFLNRDWELITLTAFIIFSYVLLGLCTARAQDGPPIPAPLKGVQISAVVTQDQAGRFEYRYSINNPSANNGQIWRFVVDITQHANEAILNSAGLLNGPLYTEQLSQIAMQRAPMVPVGIDGPSNWIYGQTYDVGPPLWGLASWGSTDEPYRILPNQSLDSFTLTSSGLPRYERPRLSQPLI